MTCPSPYTIVYTSLKSFHRHTNVHVGFTIHVCYSSSIYTNVYQGVPYPIQSGPKSMQPHFSTDTVIPAPGRSCPINTSCNNVAPVLWQTCVSAELQSGPICHNGAKNKLKVKNKNSLFTLQTFHYNYYWWSQSLLNRFGWEMYAFQRWQQPCKACSNLSIVRHNRKLRKAELF